MVRKMSGRAEDDEDVFDVDVSDDEKYNSDNVFQGLWIPYPDQVAEMFEKLDKGGVPVLKWRCPGRRPPEIEKEEEDMETDLDLSVEPKQEEQKEEKKAPPPTEFDFDDSSLETSTTKLTPRKTPGSSKGKKRVARMDKVLDDIIRQRKATEASKDQRKKASPKTPRGASACGRLFSSPRTPISAEKYAPSITPVTTPRGSGAKSPHNRLLGAKYSSPFRSTSTSPRTPSSPKTPTSGEKTPATSPSPIGCVKMPPTDKEATPNAARVMEVNVSSEGSAQTCCASMMHTSAANTTKFTPLTQALMSEPMVSSHLSANSLFNKHRNSHPQITTHPTSNTGTAAATTITTTSSSTTVTATIGAPCSSLPTNSTLAVTPQHFTTTQTASGQRPTLSLFTHQSSVVGQGAPQTGITRVAQTHHPNSPLAHSPHAHTAQSPLSQPAHSPKTHTSQSPMTHPVQSPMSHTVHSPMTQLSQSPLSQPVNSPMSQTNPSPISQPIPSPMSQHSQSPMTQLAQSPMAQPVQSPMSQPAQSPTAQSPLAQTAQSPSASQSPIAQTGQLRGTVQQNIPGTKPRLTFSGKPRVSTLDKPKLSMAGKPRMSLASPLTVSTSTIQSHLSSNTPTLQAQLNQAVQHQVLQQHLSQTSQQQVSQLAQQQRAQAISQQQQQQQQQINQAVAQQQMVSVTESSQVQMSQQQQLAQQLQLNQQPQAQLSQQQQLAQQQQQLAQQQLSQQQQLQQLSQQQAQTPQLTPQQQQQLTLALAQQQLNQQQQTGTQSMSPQMAQQLSQLIKQQRIQMTLRQQRAAQQQQQQQLAQVKAQQLVSNQQIVQQQLAQLNAQQMAQTTSQPHLAQSTVQTSQTPAQPNVTTASPAPKVWSKTSSQHQLLQAALSQVPQNQTSLSQMIQAFKSRMNPTTHPQLFKSISQLTQANQPQINQVNQLHVNQPQGTLASSSPSLSTLMASQSPTTISTQTHSASAVPFSSSENIQNTSQSSGHLTQVVYHSPASLVTNPSQIGLPATTTSVAQPATTQLPSPAITQLPSPAIAQPSLLLRKEDAISAQQTQLGIQRNEPTDYKLSIFTQAHPPSAAVTTAESVIPAHFGSQAQVTRTDASHSLARQLSNFGRKPVTSESGVLSTQLTLSETPTTNQTNTLISQSSQAPTTQTRFVPSGLLQTSIESALLARKRFVAPGDTVASNQERFTLSTMGQAINRAAHPTVSQANELSSPSGRERLTLASMLQPFDLAGLSQQEKQTLSTLTQSRDLSFLQNSTSESEATTSTSQQFATINKPVSTAGFPHMQIGEPQVSQSYIMPSYGPSAMIGKPPPPYSVAIAEKALSSMRTSMAGRKDANIVTQITSGTVASVTSATEKNVTFVKKPETSLPSTTLVWVTTPNTTSDVGGNIASSHSSFVTSQLGINTQPTFAAGGSHVSVQKISVQPQQSAMTSEMIKAQREKDDKQTLDLVNTSLSAVRTAISMGNQAYPQQTVSKDNMLIRKNLLGFSALNKPSTASDMTSVTSSGISTVAANNSLLQHMLGTSTSEHLTTTSHLIPSMSTHELNLQKMSLSSASSVTSNPTLGALTSHSHGSQVTTTSNTTSSSRPRLTTIAALLNIDSGPKTQAELQLRQLSMAGITTEGLPVTSSLPQTLSIISPITTFSTAVSKNVNLSSIATSSQVTMVPTLTSRPNPSLHATTITTESSQTEHQQQAPVSES